MSRIVSCGPLSAATPPAWANDVAQVVASVVAAIDDAHGAKIRG